MSNQELHYYWEWHFQADPETVWPFFADTNRFNYNRGNPSLELMDSERRPNAYKTLKMTVKGLEQLYDEQPFEWVKPFRHSINRRFMKGFFAEIRLLAELRPAPDGGSIGSYHTWVTPRGFIGKLVTPYLVGKITYNLFDKAFRYYDQLSVSKKDEAMANLNNKVSFAPGGEERLRTLCDEMVNQGAAPDLTMLLRDVLRTADDLTVTRMRPYYFADLVGADRRKMLELFLQATRQGVLNFRWEILCPLCRGAKDGADTLGRLPTKVHCNTCNIDFNANFERSVELVFHPNEAIRQFEGGDFCVGGPQLTPHVIAQQLLHPGEGREISLPLEEGRYRLRTLELKGGQSLAAVPGGAARATFVADGRGWSEEELALSTEPTIRLENATAQEQLMILERTVWSDQAATAAEVTALQTFRDLFTSEALRPGEQISVGSLTVVFTDLRESTRLYREIGDAPAFGLVMAHFDVLRKIIIESDGAIVKTIGDSVMAVFRRPVNAVQAMMRAQQEMASPSAGHKPLYLRVGIHHGPCVAVNLNDRFDYFGSTVNIAARLEALSTGEEVVISEAVRRDPEVAALIEQNADNLIIEPVEAALKGFEGERFEVHLLAPRVRSMAM